MSKKELLNEVLSYSDSICGYQREMDYLEHCNRELEMVKQKYDLFGKIFVQMILKGDLIIKDDPNYIIDKK